MRRCIFAEMFQRKPVLPGQSDADQLTKIFSLCGHPTEGNFPGWNRFDPKAEFIATWGPSPRRLESIIPERSVLNVVPPLFRRMNKSFHYHSAGPEALEFLDQLLTLNPLRRMTALEALDHDYFWCEPMPAEPKRYVICFLLYFVSLF